MGIETHLTFEEKPE